MNVYDANIITVPEGYVNRILDMNDVVLWERKNKPSKSTPFYFRNTSGTPTKICVRQNSSYSPYIEYQYSYDLITWSYEESTHSPDEPRWVTIPAYGIVYFRARYDKWYEVHEISPGVGVYEATCFYDNYNDYTGEPIVVGGNILSLFYGSDFTGNETTFPSSSTKLECYRFFEFVDNIVDASELILPVTSLHSSCYSSMFFGNTRLKYPPTLPATTLADSCYGSMFSGCSSLLYAPPLPATTLAPSCYSSMFEGCTSLTAAPYLPATTLAGNCYLYMFKDCSLLNEIKCLATDISAYSCRFWWVRGVAASGTFYKNASMNDWPSGPSGIPTGWTVVNL